MIFNYKQKLRANGRKKASGRTRLVKIVIFFFCAGSLYGLYEYRSPLVDLESNFRVDKGVITGATNTHWDAAYDHIDSTGASHTYIDQSVVIRSSPIFSNENMYGNISVWINDVPYATLDDLYTEEQALDDLCTGLTEGEAINITCDDDANTITIAAERASIANIGVMQPVGSDFDVDATAKLRLQATVVKLVGGDTSYATPGGGDTADHRFNIIGAGGISTSGADANITIDGSGVGPTIDKWTVFTADTNQDTADHPDSEFTFEGTDGITTLIHEDTNTIEISGSGVAGNPAGNDQEVQWNDDGAFGASSDFKYDDTNNKTVFNYDVNVVWQDGGTEVAHIYVEKAGAFYHLRLDAQKHIYLTADDTASQEIVFESGGSTYIFPNQEGAGNDGLEFDMYDASHPEIATAGGGNLYFRPDGQNAYFSNVAKDGYIPVYVGKLNVDSTNAYLDTAGYNLLLSAGTYDLAGDVVVLDANLRPDGVYPGYQDNRWDVGEPNHRWNDFWIGGNITDGNNVLSIADINTNLPIAWGDGLQFSAGTASVDQNSANLAIDVDNKIDTIQPIHGGADPAWNDIDVNTVTAGDTNAVYLLSNAGNATVSATAGDLYVYYGLGGDSVDFANAILKTTGNIETTAALTANTSVTTGLLDVDNIRLNSSTLSTTSGDLTIDPAGGDVSLAGNDLLSIGDLSAGGDVFFTYGQDYLFTRRSNSSMALQSQSAATLSSLELFSNDGDGTDNIFLLFWSYGTPEDIAPGEYSGMICKNDNTFNIYTATVAGSPIPTVFDIVLFTGANTNQIVAEADGDVVMATLPEFAAGTDLYIDGNNRLGTLESSRKYKKNIRDIENTNRIYDLRPVSYDANDDSKMTDLYGFIAEEVNEIIPEVIRYKVERVMGERPSSVDPNHMEPYIVEWRQTDIPNGVHNDRLIPLMLKEIQTLRTELNELKARVAMLEK